VITKVTLKPFIATNGQLGAHAGKAKGERLAHTAYPPTRLSLSEEQNYSFELHTQSGGCVAHQGRGLTSQKPSGWFSQ